MSIRQITLATIHTEAMVTFYEAVLGSGLTGFAAYGTTLYRGKLGGVDLLFCPNDIAGVVAEQSRHQFTIAVPDLSAALLAADGTEGSVEEVRREGSAGVSAHGVETPTVTSAILRDPDGNTIELVQT